MTCSCCSSFSSCTSEMGIMKADSFNKYFTVAVLTAINLLNYMDRFTIAGILSLLENSDRNGFIGSMEVTDTYGGLLQTAFIVSYMLLSPLFGYLGDRYRRKYIITFGILMWSFFTLAGSFSVNYWMLLGSRSLVGIGEASYATIAPTLIADLFPSEERLRMLAIFYIAMPVGSALGYINGAGVADIVHTISGQSDSWRWALRITPGLTVLAAAMVFFVVKEPVRGKTDGQRTAKGVKGKAGITGYLGDLWYLLKNNTFIFSTMGFTCVAFTTGALAQWAPIFIQRVTGMIYPPKGWGESASALIFGGMTVIAGILGTAAGSELSKFLGKYTCRAEAIVCSFSMLLAVPFLYLSLLVVQYKIVYISLISVFLAVFFACLNWTPVAAMVLYSVIPSRRATASAVQILFSHLFGDAFSPTIVGVISDRVYKLVGPYQGYYKGKAVSMEFGLFTTAFVMALGGGAFFLSSLTVEEDKKKVELYTQKKNSQVQRSANGSISSSEENPEENPEEEQRLLQETIDEKDIVEVKS